jgi:hypothetical protein
MTNFYNDQIGCFKFTSLLEQLYEATGLWEPNTPFSLRNCFAVNLALVLLLPWNHPKEIKEILGKWHSFYHTSLKTGPNLVLFLCFTGSMMVQSFR